MFKKQAASVGKDDEAKKSPREEFCESFGWWRN